MSSKGIKVKVDLDFTTGKIDKEHIRKQVNSAIDAVKINLDPKSAKDFEKEINKLGDYLTKHLNEATGKVNLKGLMSDLNNDAAFLSLDDLSKRYKSVGIDGTNSFKQVQRENDMFAKELGGTNEILSKMGDTLKNTIRWNISASVVNKFSSEMQKAYYFSKDLDRVLTDIRIVTGKSAEDMKVFSRESNLAAKELKTSTKEYGEAATLFYQQGLSDSDVKNMTEAAITSAHITGIATSEMSNLLTSTLNGYRMATDQIDQITDKFSALGATTASDFGEISVAASKVASMANTAEVPLDNLGAQLATIMSVTRESPETVGAAMKTIYSRMVAFKTDTKSIMKDLDGEAFSAPQVEAALQAYSKATGAQISLFRTAADGKKELRSMNDVLEDIGKTWDSTDDKVAKFGLTTALAGTRQQNNLIALFENWEMYEQAVDTALTSEGTTLKQNEAYMDSYEAKLKGLQAAKEGLYLAALDPDSMKGFIGGLTTTIELSAKLVDNIGGLPGILGYVAAYFSKDIVSGMSQAITYANELKLAMKQDVSDSDRKDLEKTAELLQIKKAMGEETAKEQQANLRAAIQAEKAAKIKKEAYLEEQSILQTLFEIKEDARSEEEAFAKMQANVTAESEERHLIERENIDALIEKQRELIEAKKEQREIEAQIAEEGYTDTLIVELEAVEMKLEGIGSEQEQLFINAQNSAEMSAEAWSTTAEATDKASENITRLADESERANKAAELVSSVMSVLPGSINIATDHTQSWGDTIGSIGKLMLPLIIKQLGTVASQFIAMKMGGAAMTVTLGSVLGPLGAALGVTTAIVGVVRGIGKHTKGAQTELEKYKATAEDFGQAKSEIEGMQNELDGITDRRREIDKQLKDGKDLSKEQVSELEKENDLLKERVKEIEQGISVKKLEVKEQEKELEIQGEIVRTQKIKSSIAGKWGLPKFVEYNEELTRISDKHKEAKDQMKLLGQEFDSLEEKRKNGSMGVEEYERKQAELRKAMEDTGAEVKELEDKMKDYLLMLQNMMDEATDEATKEYFQDLIDQTVKWMEDEIPGAIERTGDALDDLNDKLDDAANSVVTFNEVQYDLTDATDEFRYSNEVLLQAMEDLTKQGEISMETYGHLKDLHEDFTNVAEMEEDQIWALLVAHQDKSIEAIQQEIDQEKATIAAAKNRIQAYSNEAKALALLAGNNKNSIMGPQGQDLDQSGTAGYNQATVNMSLLDARNKAQRDIDDAYDRIQALKNIQREIINKGQRYKDIRDRDRKKPSPRKTGGSKSKTPKKSTKKSKTNTKKEREEERAHADYYEEINFLIDRNNSLLAINEARRGNLVEGTQTHLKNLDREIKLQKERQTLLHERNEQLRTEGMMLQQELSSIFKFKGSWDDNSIMITNMEALEGQTKEVEDQFKRVVEIMKELPKASTDWWKIKQQIEALEIEKMVLQFEKINKGLDYYDETLAHIDYKAHIADQEDFVSQTGYLADKIEILEKQYVLTELALDNLVDKYPPGSISAKEFAEKQKELTLRMRASHMALVDQKRALEELIETEKEAARQRAVDAKNEELQATRDKIDAIEETQDIIVEIIRKRGEEERRLAEEAHQAELDRLEEAKQKKLESYDEEYDAYKKLIEDKIKALEDQYKEEDYREQLAKEQEEANRLQREIDILSLDDSLTAKNKRADLRKQLSEQIEKIEKMERDRSRESAKKALEDELRDYEDGLDKKKDKDEEDADNQRELLEKQYKEHMEYLDKKYSNENVYAEAAEALILGQVETAQNAYKTIEQAHKEFQEEFGAGMGLLGEIIQKDFIGKLEQAQGAVVGLNKIDLSQRPRENYTTDEIKDSELYDYGYKDPKEAQEGWTPTPRPAEFIMPVYWRDEDFEKYMSNKKKWETTKDPRERARLNEENARLRAYYWGEDMKHIDKYTWKDLRGYKDGGVMDTSGLFVGHGSSQSSEVVFSAKTAKKLWEYVENLPSYEKGIMAPTFATPTLVSKGGNNYNIEFQVEGNMDSSILPEVKEMIKSAIEESEEADRRELNKAGIFRSI